MHYLWAYVVPLGHMYCPCLYCLVNSDTVLFRHDQCLLVTVYSMGGYVFQLDLFAKMDFIGLLYKLWAADSEK